MKHVKRFSSVSELSEALANGKVLKYQDNPVSKRRAERHKSWAGRTLQEAYDLLAYGDAKAARKIKAAGEILSSETGGAPTIETSVVGCVPCVPNYLMGVPKQMLKVTREPRKTPIIDIYLDTAIWDGIEVDKAARAAAKIANVIAATELAGVRVNLFAMVASEKNGNKCAMVVKLKDDDAPLNLLNVAFPLTDAAFCRCIYLDYVDKYFDAPLDCYGSVMSGDRVQQEFNLEGLVFSIGDMINRDQSIKQIADRVNEYIKKTGEGE